MSPKPPTPAWQSWIRAVLPPLLLLAVGIFGTDAGLARQRLIRPFTNVILHRTAEGWQRLTNAPVNPRHLLISRAGAVWAVGDTISVWQDHAWRTFTSTELATSGPYLPGAAALDRDEVWVPTYHSILRWDGKHWTSYPEAAPQDRPAFIMAAAGRVWAIDEHGNLAQFNGHWTVQRTALPASAGDYWPELALTSDARLWLVQDGLWRLDGSRWIPVKPGGRELKGVSLLDTTGDILWLWGDGKLHRFSSNETILTYSRADLGLSDTEWLNHVIATDRSFLFASSAGILEFDGSAWRRIQPPQGEVKGIQTLQLSPDGSLWALGRIPTPHYGLLAALNAVVMFSLLTFVIAAPVWLYRRRQWHQFSQYLRRTAEHGLGESSEELRRAEREFARRASWRGGVGTSAAVVGGIAGYLILLHFWHAAPRWIYLAIALVLHLAITIWLSAVPRTPKPNDPIEPRRAFRYDWSNTWKALPGSLVVFLLLNPQPSKYYGFCFICLLLIAWPDLVLDTKVIPSKRIIWYLRPNSPSALRLRAQVLLAEGQFREAEEVARRAIAKLRGGPDHAHAFEILGDALLEQSRYDEAQRSLQTAVCAVPQYRHPYCGMAEILLRRRTNPERALELVEKLVWHRSVRLYMIFGEHRDDYWSLKTWALAQLRRTAEAEEAATNAIRFTNKKSRPDVACTYRRLGLAMEALGNRQRAHEYLQRACDADPHGRWGTLAREAMSAFGTPATPTR